MEEELEVRKKIVVLLELEVRRDGEGDDGVGGDLV